MPFYKIYKSNSKADLFLFFFSPSLKPVLSSLIFNIQNSLLSVSLWRHASQHQVNRTWLVPQSGSTPLPLLYTHILCHQTVTDITQAIFSFKQCLTIHLQHKSRNKHWSNLNIVCFLKLSLVITSFIKPLRGVTSDEALNLTVLSLVCLDVHLALALLKVVSAVPSSPPLVPCTAPCPLQMG